LRDSDTGLEASGDKEPEKTAILELEFVAFGERGKRRDGNRDVGWLAVGHAGEPFASDADDGERMAFDVDLFADDVEGASETALPEVVAENGDLRGGRGIGIGGNEETAEKRSDAELGVGVAGDAGDVFTRKDAVGFHVPHATAAPADKAGENALVALEFTEHGVRKGDFGVGASGSELDKLFGVLDGEVAEEEGVD
jgi:hypothetical protein